MADPSEQRGSAAVVGVILRPVRRVGGGRLDVSGQRGLFDVRVMAPEPADDLALGELLVQLTDAFFHSCMRITLVRSDSEDISARYACAPLWVGGDRRVVLLPQQSQ